MPASVGPNSDLENIPAGESDQIAESTELMGALVDRRYAQKDRFLRGVHAKDHGCVEATFTIGDDIPPAYRVGVFKNAGQTFRAAIRFSNAAPLVEPDVLKEKSLQDPDVLVPVHGSRGMAIKLYDVEGDRLTPDDGEQTQDFLMINQPVFAFANVEDYLELNRIIRDNDAAAPGFFQRANLSPEALQRTKRSGGIIARIKGFLEPFQPHPLSPFDNMYFSAAPFSLGAGQVMKFACKPVNPMSGELGDAVHDPDYLRNAMRARMASAGDKVICFDFQIQVRDAQSLAGKVDTDIEDACTEWTEPFITVARITIASQDVSSNKRQEFCESLFYTPWHGVVDHRPLGGINRVRRDVYKISAERRHCPVSPLLP